MNQLFYKRASTILPLISFILWLLGLILHMNTTIPEGIVWLPFIFAQLIISIICGKLIEDLKEKTYKDPLTGLANRRFFLEELTSELERMKRTNSSISLAMIDLDDFKDINDTYGHLKGDEVLREVAHILQSNTRAIDTVSRWGGEEFAVILPDTDIENASIFASRIRKIVEEFGFVSNLTVSIGLISTNDKMNMERLVQLADDALYKAKTKKNEVVTSDYCIAGM